MTQNDSITKQVFLEKLLKQDTKEMGLSDLIQIQEKFQDPLILSVILHQLLEERKKTNDILKELYEKYDSLQFQLKQKQENTENKEIINILPEIDDKIISFIREKQKVDAELVQEQFNYKGSNAASQRLNKLVKEGYLRKVQAGRKVYFIVR
jgi:CII-binding regulator of phage lambda lysogenization HflD